MSTSEPSCALVSKIKEPLRSILLTTFSNRNRVLVDKLRNYSEETAKYYLVYKGITPLFFFSLQTSCIFAEPYTLSEKLIHAAKQLADTLQNPDANLTNKKAILVAAYGDDDDVKISRIVALSEDECKSKVRDLCTAMQYLADLNDPDVLNSVIYNKVTPAIELVEFCKCESGDSMNLWMDLRAQWDSSGLVHTAGEFVFYMYILPIVFQVSQHVGCKLLLLYAADSSETESLVNYYMSRLHFAKPGGKMVVNKPKYDVGCKLLVQDLDELKKIREGVIKDFTSMQHT